MKRRIILAPKIHINPVVIDILANAELYINLTELFYSPPGMISVVHRDLYGEDISKINWVIGGSESIFNWYETKLTNPVQGASSNKYIAYTSDEVTLLDNTPLHTPSLIQAAVPHNVINATEPRWSVSLTIYDKKTHYHAAFDDVATRLKSISVT
jgi:hypothetical protein